MADIEDRQFENHGRLKDLRVEHRRLDQEIEQLTAEVYLDQLRIRRLKKRKLMQRDIIVRIESEQIPDLNA